MKKLLTLLALSLLSGCSLIPTPLSSDPRKITMQTVYDPYSGRHAVVGEEVNQPRFPDIAGAFIRGAVDARTQQIAFVQVQVNLWSQSGWYFLGSAADRTARKFPVLVLEQKVLYGGKIEESVGVKFPYDYVKARINTGLDFAVMGKRNSIKVNLPPAYVQAFVIHFDAAIQKPKPYTGPTNTEYLGQ
jgi:hypothetical protein